jgi:hypothetical protein
MAANSSSSCERRKTLKHTRSLSTAVRGDAKCGSILKLALNQPYTLIVLAPLILILSPVAIMRAPTDIFPRISIPVVAVAGTIRVSPFGDGVTGYHCL